MGDINLDLLKPDEVPEYWSDIVEAFSLTQLINEPTRVTEKSQTLLVHMYVTAPDNIRKHHVPKSGMSDHYPVCLVHKWVVSIQMGSENLQNVESEKILGIIINQNLSWAEHLKKTTAAVNSKVAY